jgi:YVTN family beta-propeller protein
LKHGVAPFLALVLAVTLTAGSAASPLQSAKRKPVPCAKLKRKPPRCRKSVVRPLPPPPAAAVVARIAVGPRPEQIAFGDGSVWVARADASVARVDAASNSIVATVQAPASSVEPWLGFGEGALWLSNFDDNSVWRVDPATNQVVAKITVGSAPEGIAFTPGAVWVANHHGTPYGSVARIDPATNRVVATVPAGLPQLCCGPQGIAGTPDAVWVGVPNLDALVRLDPAANTVAAQVQVRPACGGVAADADGVWIAGGCGSNAVFRIDPQTNRVVARIVVTGKTRAVALGLGAVWVTTDTSLVRIDPTTNKVAGASAVDEATGVAVSTDAVWVLSRSAGILVRFRPV